MTALPKLSKPATRALAFAGVTQLEDVARWTEIGLAMLHGVGPKAIRILKPALAEHGLDFHPEAGD